MHPKLRQFLFPKVTPAFIIRLIFVAACAYAFFGFVCTPFVIRGRSMEPTYHDSGFNFVWRPRYFFAEPQRGDVVAVRLAGYKVMLLKRVVALAGDAVEFRSGVLFVNDKAVSEPYVQGPCNWNLPPRQVEPGRLYLVGDNRSMPMENHDFGQTSKYRIVGAPLW